MAQSRRATSLHIFTQGMGCSCCYVAHLLLRPSPHADVEPGQIRLLDCDERLVLPTNSLVRLLVTSSDVIHSWAVPSLGVKIDAIPGRLNQVRPLVLVLTLLMIMQDLGVVVLARGGGNACRSIDKFSLNQVRPRALLLTLLSTCC
jgi:hypothetical protein